MPPVREEPELLGGRAARQPMAGQGHEVRAARPAETEDQAKARAGQEIGALLGSPFYDLWALAAVSEIISALHERVATGA